jgi:hypothetical protein
LGGGAIGGDSGWVISSVVGIGACSCGWFC